MECNDALILISGHLDHTNTVEEEAALQAHLDGCPACRKLLAAYKSIDGSLAEMEAPVPQDFAAALMSRISEEAEPGRKAKRRPMLRIGTAAGLVAAVLVLLIGTGVFRLPAPDDRTNTSLTDAVMARSAYEAGQYGAFSEQAAAFSTAQLPPEAALSEDEMNQPADSEPTQDNPFYGNLKGRSSLLGKQALALGMELSQRTTAPVLIYGGLDENFPEELAALAPELAPMLEKLQPVAGEDGELLLATDYQTLQTIQAWFHLALSEGAQELIQRFEGQEIEGTYIGDVITFNPRITVEQWPERWPEDWTERWLAEENWALFYPYDGYEPESGDLAYLVLIPDTQAQDTDQ